MLPKLLAGLRVEAVKLLVVEIEDIVAQGERDIERVAVAGELVGQRERRRHGADPSRPSRSRRNR